MNFSPLLIRSINPAVTQARSLLPTTAKLTIPAGLDWVIRQHLALESAFAQVKACAANGADGTQRRADDLSRLSQLLSRDGRKDIHQITLWGYELSVLYSFLRQQEQSYPDWSVAQIPTKARLTIRADLRGLLPVLHGICRRVDVYAARPVVHY